MLRRPSLLLGTVLLAAACGPRAGSETPKCEEAVDGPSRSPSSGLRRDKLATDEDCLRMANKMLELTEAELGMEFNQSLSKPKVLKVELECRERVVWRSQVHCVLRAATLDEAAACTGGEISAPASE